MNRLLGLLGLGARAGNVALGVDAVRRGLQRDEFACVVVAADASPRTIEKVVRLARGRQVDVVRGPAADEIGAQLGRPPVMAAGVRDRALADGIRQTVS
ncbi:MAG: L7Ae/L30e/S12e/Gadd45 family ribosomal protein [Gemmatimonadales bacterium]